MINIFTTTWDLAIQKPGEKVFNVIPNSYNFWAADPFLFKYKDKVYVFAELWLYKENKGAIGYCCLNNKKKGWKIVIKEPYHLSYPFLFEFENNIYMCPESYQNNTISLYKAISFPDRWEKLAPIETGIRAVDTTLFNYDNNLFGFTFSLDQQALLLFKLNTHGKFTLEFLENNPINNDLSTARMAGNIVRKDGKLIRVSQDCSNIYGEALMFSYFNIEKNVYTERLFKRLNVQDFIIDKSKKYIGVHTYNSLEGYHIIDLKFQCINPYDLYCKVIRKIRSIIYG